MTMQVTSPRRRAARDGLLILGGGFAGATLARRFGGGTIVSVDNSMLYSSMLPEAASGTLEPRHVVVPLRAMCRRSELVLGEVTGRDAERRCVRVETGDGPVELAYERLVVALGSIPRTLPIPGLAEHGIGFKSFTDAIFLRNHMLRQMELADTEVDDGEATAHLSFVFVGAGYAGVEALGETQDLVRDALRYYPRLRWVRQRWVLVDLADRVLPSIPSRLGEYAAQQLRSRGVEIRTGTGLAEVERGRVTLDDGTVIPSHTLVWSAGVAPSPALADLDLPLDDRGKVRIDDGLRVDGQAGVWALGDCAAVPNSATGEHDPPTAQHAIRQARYLARSLAGSAPGAYAYRSLGQVATLGRYKGVAVVRGLKFGGFLGWFITRSYHLYALPLPQRRLRVVADWTISLLFRRDVVTLGSVREAPQLARGGLPPDEPVTGPYRDVGR